MTGQEFASIVKNIRVRDHQLLLAIETSFGTIWEDGDDFGGVFWRYVDSTKDDHVNVRARMKAPDIHTGELTWINRDHSFTPAFFKTEREVNEVILKVLTELWEHELREQFRYKDERIFDPHKEERKEVA